MACSKDKKMSLTFLKYLLHLKLSVIFMDADD